MNAHTSAALTVLCTLAPTAALAHPGHGATEHHVTHLGTFWTEPVLAILFAAVAAVAAVVMIAWRQRRRTDPIPRG